MKTVRYRFRLPQHGEPGHIRYLCCSTTVGDPRIGAKCHATVTYKVARTRDAKAGVRYACDEHSAEYPDPPKGLA